MLPHCAQQVVFMGSAWSALFYTEMCFCIWIRCSLLLTGLTVANLVGLHLSWEGEEVEVGSQTTNRHEPWERLEILRAF